MATLCKEAVGYLNMKPVSNTGTWLIVPTYLTCNKVQCIQLQTIKEAALRLTLLI